jgi:hypothetical protein
MFCCHDFENQQVCANLSELNTHISNSYRVKKLSEMKEVLKGYQNTAEVCNEENMAIRSRTIFNMVNEWRVHNLLYELHLFRSHTANVDLEREPKWYMTLAYTILSPFYFHFL